MVDAVQMQIVQIPWEAELATATLDIQVFSSVHLACDVQSCIKAIFIGNISSVDERLSRQFEIIGLPSLFSFFFLYSFKKTTNYKNSKIN